MLPPVKLNVYQVKIIATEQKLYRHIDMYKVNGWASKSCYLEDGCDGDCNGNDNGDGNGDGDGDW